MKMIKIAANKMVRLMLLFESINIKMTGATVSFHLLLIWTPGETILSTSGQSSDTAKERQTKIEKRTCSDTLKNYTKGKTPVSLTNI